MFKLLKETAQGTVEYLILLSFVASITLGLLSSTTFIKEKLKSSKIGIRNRFAGAGLEVTRSDFTFKAPNIKGTGGANANANGKNKEDKNKEAGDESGDEGAGYNAPDQAKAEGAGTNNSSTQSEEENNLNGEYDIENENIVSDTDVEEAKSNSEYAGMSDEEIRQKLKEERQMARAAMSEEDKKKASLSGMFGEEDEFARRKKDKKPFDWGFLKIIIIIAVIGFFIFMFVKAKQSK